MPNQRYPQRKSPRLRGYDYAEEGAYFVTLCVQNHLHLFGEVNGDTMNHNAAGEMVAYWWQKLPSKFADIDLDLSVVMPNHFHAIVVIQRGLVTGGTKDSPLHTRLSDAIRWFKIMATNAYIRGVKSQNWERFPGKLWQRSYHDHIIRDENSLNHLREYVLYNPARWSADRFYA